MLELEKFALSNSAKLVQLMLLLAFGYTIGTFPTHCPCSTACVEKEQKK